MNAVSGNGTRPRRTRPVARVAQAARLATLLLAAATAAATATATTSARPAAPALFFDDFAHASPDGLRAQGWTLRTQAGHPGVPGARWSADGISLQREGATTLLRLSGHTDGTAAGTVQAQLCHRRQALRGTYAARVRYGNQPVQGTGGDPVIQSFYAVAPLKHDFDPDFSEIDWEYLANGGWGSPDTRLYAVSWQTVRLDPWQSHNAAHEEKRRLDGWHTLVMQVRDDGHTHWFIDGRPVARHGGRHAPVQPMAISFSLWFSPGGLLPPSAEPRVWASDVDWVWLAPGRTVAPAEVERQVRQLQRRGVTAQDTVHGTVPSLPSPCNF